MLGLILTITVLHTVETLLRDATNQLVSNAHLIHYQSLLLDNYRMTFGKSLAINPATLLLKDYPEEPIHDSLEMLNVI